MQKPIAILNAPNVRLHCGCQKERERLLSHAQNADGNLPQEHKNTFFEELIAPEQKSSRASRFTVVQKEFYV